MQHTHAMHAMQEASICGALRLAYAKVHIRMLYIDSFKILHLCRIDSVTPLKFTSVQDRFCHAFKIYICAG